MGRKKHGEAGREVKVIQKQQRLRMLEEAYLNGTRKPAELAARFGVGVPTIQKYIREMKNGWKEDTTEEQRQELIERQWNLHKLSLQSYERSRKDEQTTTTTYKPVSCEQCAGTGFEDEEHNTTPCAGCEGTGKRSVEETQTKVKGQAGDASFLKEARQNLQELAKLMGMDVKQVNIKGQVNHAHIHATPQDLFPGATDDDIIAAKKAMDRLIIDPPPPVKS